MIPGVRCLGTCCEEARPRLYREHGTAVAPYQHEGCALPGAAKRYYDRRLRLPVLGPDPDLAALLGKESLAKERENPS